MNEISVFEYDISQPFKHDIDFLSSDEKERLKKITNNKRSSEFLHSRYYLKKHLSTLLNKTMPAIHIHYNKHGKPSVCSESIHFSLAHKHNKLALAFSHSAVGIDIECSTTNCNHEKLAKKILSETEYKLYLNAENKKETFLVFWSIKEAITKLEGAAFLVLIKRLEFLKYKDSYYWYKNQANNKTIEVYLEQSNTDIKTIAYYTEAFD